MLQKTRGHLSTKRVRLVVLLAAAAVGIAILRLFFIQVLHHKQYSDLAKRQQNLKVDAEPRRGDIYFQNKDGTTLTAATTKEGFLLYLNTKALQNPNETYSALNEIVSIDKEVFDKAAGKPNDPYEIIKRRLTAAQAEAVKARNFAGVGLQEEKWRSYPGGILGSHVLGFVSTPNDTAEGAYGIERYFNETLGGVSAKKTGSAGFLETLKKQFEREPEAGGNVLLTIEPTVQRFLETEIKKTADLWRPESGGMLVLEPKTGKIIALTALPAYDPNEYYKEADLEVFLNPFVEKIFELGSVFKPLTMAAAIDRGAITPQTTYVDKGEVKVGIATIKNFDGKARGVRTMTQVLEESLNTGAVFAMQQLGGERLREYFINFGLGDKTQIDLPGEIKGDISNLKSGREVEFATASFGQGIAVTPLELVMALAALANEGKLMRPLVVETGPEKMPETVRQVVTPETAIAVSRMLVDVVDTSLAGGKAKIPGYRIAAKTGTAQIPKQNSGGYSEDFLHSFFGYFPAYDARFLIFMFLERPRGATYASHTLTDPFINTLRFLINYYVIPPDR